MALNPLVQALLDQMSTSTAAPTDSLVSAQQRVAEQQAAAQAAKFQAAALKASPAANTYTINPLNYTAGSAGSGGGGGGGGMGASYGSSGGIDYDRIMRTIRQRESGNNYTAQNPHGSASGAYQFINSTWRGLGGSTASAKQASRSEQDRIAKKYIDQALKASGGDWRTVPVYWYLGHVPKGSEWDRVPKGGNTLTPRQYQNAWLKSYG